MKKSVVVIVIILFLFPVHLFAGWPTQFPTGLTVYNPEKVYPGYTMLSSLRANPLLIDMDGMTVRFWNLKIPGPTPAKLLPNGHLLFLEFHAFVEYDHSGKLVRSIKMPEGVNSHHDFHVFENGNILVACFRTINRPEIAPRSLQDDCLLEFSPDGKLIWEWQAADHFEEFGLTAEMKERIRNYNGGREGYSYDWAHLNAVDPLPPNPINSDPRFKQGNLIMSFRHLNETIIIDRETGKIVWHLGPDYSDYPDLGSIITQHDSKMIAPDCPGAGNILIFDNGGDAFFTDYHRDHSRIVEVDPVTYKPVWIYEVARDARQFYSNHISGAQRLPNGNTLICSGHLSRIFEVTPDKEIVWEYILPFHYDEKDPGNRPWVYRAIRYPENYFNVRFTTGEREQQANTLLKRARENWMKAREDYISVSKLYSDIDWIAQPSREGP